MKISKKLILLPISVLALTGCGKNDNKEEDKPAAKTYTITWKNYDGTVLEVDKKVKEGSTPKYDGDTPEKAPTDLKQYVFSGWDPKVVKVTKDATYTAQFNEETRKYNITWLDGDDNVLKVDQVEVNTMPSYVGVDPTKSSTAQYSYAWDSGWTPEIVLATEDATYKATFTPSTRTYTVHWVNYDGSELETDEDVPFGTFPTYNGEDPVRPQDAQYTYAWNTEQKWTQEVSSVTGDVTYTANFIPTTRTYTITWKDGNGDVLGYSNDVPYGTTPSYTGDTPTKDQTAEIHYTFNETWDPQIAPVTGDCIYTAQFDESKALYTYKFVNWNGDLLDSHPDIEYDKTFEEAIELYEGIEPTCNEVPHTNYEFDGFEEQLPIVGFNRVFKAKFHAVSSKPSAFTYTFSSDHYIVTGFSEAVTEVITIPSEYNDNVNGPHAVTALGAEAFRSVDSKKVTIPSTVTEIGSYCFAWCDDIEKVVIDGSPNIGEYAFYQNESLLSFEMKGTGKYVIGNSAFYGDPFKSIQLGEGLKSIGDYCFAHCGLESFSFASFTNIEPEEKVTVIPVRAFEGCSNLASINFGTNIESIGFYAFKGCAALDVIDIPDSVTSINNSFYDCGELSLVKIGSGITYFSLSYFSGTTRIDEFDVSGDNANMKDIDGAIFSKDGTKLIAFPSGSDGDNGTYVVPNGTTEIGTLAFAYAEKLETITICEGVVDIASQAFYVCGATTINLPESLLSINDNAFTNSLITSLYIPEGVTYISSSAFVDAQYIETLTIDKDNAKYKTADLVIYNKAGDELVLVLNCKTGDFTTPDGVKSIRDHAFYSSKLDNITLKDEVTTLGDHCFRSASGNINIGAGVEIIPQYCFAYSSFSSITLPNQITTIKSYAFSYADIESFTAPASCTSIEQDCFEYCDSLTTVNLGSVAEFGSYCFQGCALTSVTLNSSVTTIRQGMFADCDSLLTLDMENASITAIPNWFAANSDLITTVKIPSTVTSIGQNAFKDCRDLVSFTWPTSLQTVGEYAFVNCFDLENITLPATMTGIGQAAFSSVKATSITYLGTAENWAAFKANRHEYWADWVGTIHMETIKCSDVDLPTSEAANR